MQQTGFHHANMLDSQLRIDLGNQQTEMLAMVQNLITDAQVEQDLIPILIEKLAANTAINAAQEQMLQILQ